jgi:hypothetical protein
MLDELATDSIGRWRGDRSELHHSGPCYPVIQIQNGAIDAVCSLFHGMLFATPTGIDSMVSTQSAPAIPALRSSAFQSAPGSWSVALINRGSADLRGSFEIAAGAGNHLQARRLLAPTVAATSGVIARA